jgi:hypothetical protein
MSCPNYFQATQLSAAFQVRHLRQRARLSHADCQDLEQELILDALARESRFDPKRASARTFTSVTCAHRANELLTSWAQLRDREICSEWLDAGEALEMDDCEQDSLHAENNLDFTLTLIDLDRLLYNLPEPLVALACALICHEDSCGARASLGLSPSTYRRRLIELRMHLRMFGLRLA